MGNQWRLCPVSGITFLAPLLPRARSGVAGERDLERVVRQGAANGTLSGGVS